MGACTRGLARIMHFCARARKKEKLSRENKKEREMIGMEPVSSGMLKSVVFPTRRGIGYGGIRL